MLRPGLVPAVCIVALGAIAASAWPTGKAAWAIGLLVCLAATTLFLVYKRRWHLVVYLLAALVGASVFVVTVKQQQRSMLAPGCDGKTFTGGLKITSLPVAKGQQWQFIATTHKAENIPEGSSELARCFASTPAAIKLSWWQAANVAYTPKQGDTLTATFKLRRPYSSLNPGGFDYVAWLWRQQVNATGYIKSLEEYRSSAKTSLRSGLERRINDVLEGHVARPLVLALTVGQRSELSQDLWRAARHTGLSHLLAISGLHLGLIAAAFLFFTKLLSRQFPRERGWSLAWLLAPSMAAASVYAYLAGWPLSTQRAWVMLLVFWLATWVNWRMPRYLPWAVALALCLLLQPLNVLDGGFYLSFAAVAVLLWFTVGASGASWRGRVAWALKLQTVLLLGLLPFQLQFFGGFSLLALPLNLLFIPPFALLVLPALLAVCAGLMLGIELANHGLLFIADILALCQNALLNIEEWAGEYWFAWQLVGQPHWPQAMLLCVALLALALPKGLGVRAVGFVIALAATVSVFVSSPASDLDDAEFRITSFDAGQGTALLIQTKNHNVMYDTAAAWRSGGSAMQTMVLPALANMGIKSLNLIIVSHDDNDHVGGLPALLAQYPGSQIIGLESAPCTVGFTKISAGVSFEVLSPSGGVNNHNDQSCVIKISSKFGTALLTGDISRQVEARLLEDNAAIAADWLLVPHHGSASSSSAAFINAVRPNTAVITSGHNNRYRLPAAKVVDRYQKLLPTLALFNTAEDGAVVSEFSAGCQPCNAAMSDDLRWWQRQQQ